MGPEEAAERLAGKRLAVLTGAGMSVASGIPDFRSPGGLWSTFPPHEYATRAAFAQDPEKVWNMFHGLYDVVDGAEPNAAHDALARLEKARILLGVITQNIDGLHRRAGSHRIIAYHGNGRILRCLGCGYHCDWPHDPRCPDCGAWLKPDIILFGDPLHEGVIHEAEGLARYCDALLVLGTSAEVWPAASLPGIAQEAGAVVIDFNLERTDLAESLEIPTVLGDIVDTLPRFADRLLALSGQSTSAM